MRASEWIRSQRLLPHLAGLRSYGLYSYDLYSYGPSGSDLSGRRHILQGRASGIISATHTGMHMSTGTAVGTHVYAHAHTCYSTCLDARYQTCYNAFLVTPLDRCCDTCYGT